jgi:hypothetical protein
LIVLRMDNPHPERAVVAIEFEAEPVSLANPWILAVTLEPGKTGPPTPDSRR